MVIQGLFLLGEEQVAVFRYAFQYTGQAGAANPLFAGHGNLDAMAFQDLDHALVGRDVEDLAAAGDLY